MPPNAQEFAMTNDDKDVLRKSISEAQRKKDPHAGPGESYPEDPEHIKAAWDLAGHAANPDAVRARVLAYAKAHGLMSHLPKSAQATGSAKKAKTGDMRAVMGEAYHGTEPHSWERRHLLQVAADRHLLQHLPPEAHTDLHEFGIRHSHPDMHTGIMPTLHGENEADVEDDPDDPAYPLMHHHVVTKAQSMTGTSAAIPKATFGLIQKSWEVDGVQYIEGWMSTPDRDLEKDVVEPEAFLGTPLSDYFARSAPLSLEHGTNALPAGHLQKAAIIRDGRVLQEEAHPTDPAEFGHLPTSGSGVWVRAIINEEPAVSTVRKGNVGGMSFIGNFTRSERLPGGGRRLLQINPLIESTVAAYPVNPKAAFTRVQKALGLDLVPQETPQMNDEEFEAFMLEAANRAAVKREAEANQQAQKAITAETLADVLAAFQSKLLASVEEKVQKAFDDAQVPARGEGVGRKGVAPSAETTLSLDTDPVAYLIKKGEAGEELTIREKEVAGKLWNAALAKGMSFDAAVED
jgi:hypothetical protein